MADQKFAASLSFPADLGEPVQVCCQGLSRGLFALRLLLLAAVLAGLIYLGATFLTGNNFLLAAVGLLVLALFLTFGGGSKLLSYLDQWGDTAVATDDGVAYCHKGTWQTMRWDEIDQLVASKERVGDLSGGSDEYGIGLLIGLLHMFLSGHRYTYRLVSTNGSEINVGGTLSGGAQLMETARVRSYPHRRQRAQDAFDAGLDVYFGDASISKFHGVWFNDRRYDWGEIESVKRTTRDGTEYLEVKQKGKLISGTARTSTSKLPNVDVLHDVVNHEVFIAGLKPA